MVYILSVLINAFEIRENKDLEILETDLEAHFLERNVFARYSLHVGRTRDKVQDKVNLKWNERGEVSVVLNSSM